MICVRNVTNHLNVHKHTKINKRVSLASHFPSNYRHRLCPVEWRKLPSKSSMPSLFLSPSFISSSISSSEMGSPELRMIWANSSLSITPSPFLQESAAKTNGYAQKHGGQAAGVHAVTQGAYLSKTRKHSANSSSLLPAWSSLSSLTIMTKNSSKSMVPLPEVAQGAMLAIVARVPFESHFCAWLYARTHRQTTIWNCLMVLIEWLYSRKRWNKTASWTCDCVLRKGERFVRKIVVTHN